jgi:hypothetical protein
VVNDRQTITPIEEPYDDMERQLLERIQEIRLEYEARIKPYVDALARSRTCKPVRWLVSVPNEAEIERLRPHGRAAGNMWAALDGESC